MAAAAVVRVPQEYPTIQGAIDSSTNGDTVVVDTGRYVENLDFGNRNIVVASLFLFDPDSSHISRTVIDGDRKGSVVTFPHGNESSLIGFTIVNGEFPYGGGILCDASNPRISHCILRNNRSESTGGAIYAEGAAPTISHCLFTRNFSYFGGAVATGFSRVVITNSTFYANSAVSGGAISNYYSQTTLVNCILWNNYPEEVSYHTEEVTAAYSDVRGGWSGEGNIDADPLFLHAQGGRFHLQESSPCIDAGTDLFVWEGDTLVNLDRETYAGSAPDMGAYEFGAVLEGVSEGVVPTGFALHQNTPNPFNPATTIAYTLPERSAVLLTVHDILGRRVRTLAKEIEEPGFKSVVWDGTDDLGQQVSAGVYLYRIQAREFVQTRKVVLLK